MSHRAPSIQSICAARNEWGCNCGPAALAFAAQRSLDDVRGKIPGFETKGFTTPTMMRAGLAALGVAADEVPARREEMFADQPALVFIQFTGPWTEPGANPRWAYTHTHWIGTLGPAAASWTFDVNCGVTSFGRWERELLPMLLTNRRTGWFPKLILRVRREEPWRAAGSIVG